MIVCPPATARLFTETLPAQIRLSAVLALVSVFLGYGLATLGPPALGYDIALNAAGMIGAVSGLMFGAAVMHRSWTLARLSGRETLSLSS